MAGRLISPIQIILRLLLIVSLLVGCGVTAFVAQLVSQPMEQVEMSYWEFLADRIGVISQQSPRCQAMHLTSFLVAVPVYPVLYSLAGLFPDSLLDRSLQPHPAIPEQITWAELPQTWWTLVQVVSWDAWVTQRLPDTLPECDLNPPIPEN